MSARYFLDTNVFVYCFDRQNRRKQQQAERLVAKALGDHLGVISTQVVQEFLNVATRKFASPMSLEESRAYIDTVLSPLCEVFPTIALYGEALSLQGDGGWSFYDSLIIASALEARCSVLYSEDMQDGQTIRGMKIVNPFREVAKEAR